MQWIGANYQHLRRKEMPAEGGEAREVLRIQAPEEISAVGWTPDGRSLLFAKQRRKSPTREKAPLRRVPVEGGEPQKLELAMEHLQPHLSIHPDGQRIAFTAGLWDSELWGMENFLPVAKAARLE